MDSRGLRRHCKSLSRRDGRWWTLACPPDGIGNPVHRSIPEDARCLPNSEGHSEDDRHVDHRGSCGHRWRRWHWGWRPGDEPPIRSGHSCECAVRERLMWRPRCAPGGLAVKIVRVPTKVRFGSSFIATVVVTDATQSPIDLLTPAGCRPAFAVALTNADFAPQVSFEAMCITGAMVISPGSTSFHVPVSVDFLSCARPRSAEACIAGIYPPGTYVAVLIGSGQTPLPEAVSAPIKVVYPCSTGTQCAHRAAR